MIHIKNKTTKLFSYLAILLFIACTKSGTVIEGLLPNENYDKQVVYWVPMEGASSETVDSTYIHKNMFRLVVSPYNRNKIGIIREKPQFRLDLQDILVFTETGTVHVKFDSISSASGTPLNETLQKWKNSKMLHDRETYALRKELRTANTADESRIKEEIEKKSAIHYNDVYQIVFENKNNEVGKFIHSLYKSFFTPEQNHALNTKQ
jgi:uncharacterized protein YerC